jgi:hypothetical protein
MPKLIALPNCNYTFVRQKHGERGFELLELKDNVFGWNSNLDTCQGYFPGSMINEKFGEQLNEAENNGYKVTVNVFDENHKHTTTIINEFKDMN